MYESVGKVTVIFKPRLNRPPVTFNQGYYPLGLLCNDGFVKIKEHTNPRDKITIFPASDVQEVLAEGPYK